MDKSTLKWKKFVENPADGKNVGDVPGIGPASVKKLERYHIVKAEQLLWQFFLLNKNGADLLKFIEEKGVGSEDATTAVEAIKEYWKGHIVKKSLPPASVKNDGIATTAATPPISSPPAQRLQVQASGQTISQEDVKKLVENQKKVLENQTKILVVLKTWESKACNSMVQLES